MPRRLAITAPHVVEVLNYEDRAPGDNEVMVRTEIASGKHGTTQAMFDNVNFRGYDFDQDMRLFVEKDSKDEGKNERKPLNTGTTGVGVVEAVGAKVERWKVGDRVFGFMDIRETNICNEDSLWELGDIDPTEALCIEPAYVSFHCIRESNLRFGDTVVVVGLGAIGLIAVQMAHKAGAETVIAVDPLEPRRNWAKNNGADYVLNPSECDVGLEVHRLTSGKGTDISIEVSGSYQALQTAMRCTRVMGIVCSAGFYQGEAHSLWLGREWHHNRLNIVVPHGCGWGHVPRDFPRWDEKRAYDSMVSLLRKGYLRVPGLIHPIVSIEDGPKVWELIEKKPAEVIKYAVRF